ncbi:helix-turn-helix domain-containing protein [Thermobifida halotolerans]|uniref:Helix-turn-helix domain-containing protein n=2 Tax=Thermobifida halotolerans TaxID=483545 RepID=A0AA97LVQ7_9ACTN|nr:helix-turn-helix domain-containing protein [Thermobifida halotolerans]
MPRSFPPVKGSRYTSRPRPDRRPDTPTEWYRPPKASFISLTTHVATFTISRVIKNTATRRPPSPHLVELGNFLKARRAEITPAQVGLPGSGTRRTPGLRREEVALLAGVGVSWYTWIEQGRAASVSGEVLDAIARALRLGEAQRLYLRRLAGVSAEPEPAEIRPDPKAFQPFVDNWLPNPAYVADRYWNLVAVNETVRVLMGLDAPQNLLLDFFTNEQTRKRYPLWEDDAPIAVARFRSQAARYSSDPGFAALVTRLCGESPEFAELWGRHEVLEDSCGTEILQHPTTGNLSFTRATLDFTSRIALRLTVFVPITGTGTEDALEPLLRVSREKHTISFRVRGQRRRSVPSSRAEYEERFLSHACCTGEALQPDLPDPYLPLGRPPSHVHT